MNTGGPAFPVPDTYHPNGQVQFGSNGMTLLDWYAGQETLAEFDHPEASYGDKLATAFAGPKPQGGWAEDPHGMFEWEARVRAGMKYTRATAMLAEKARREAVGNGSAQPREVDDDHWAKFQDGIIITFEPTMGWCASIREGSLGSGNTIAEAVANLRTMWEERSAAPVVQQSSTTDNAAKVAELQAANRELVEALDNIIDGWVDRNDDAELATKARTILSKHKGAK